MGCPAAPYWATASWSQVNRQRMSQVRVILLCPPFSFLVVSGSSFLVKADWPLLKHFEVSGISVSSMSALCKGSWPYLDTLALTESRGAFGFQGAAELVKGDWPCLTSLNLCNCDLDAASMNVIVEMSNWPLLASLDISYNYEHTSSYMSMLPTFKGRWPLLQRLREYDDMHRMNYVGSNCPV